jgi:hypothetical protein
MYIFYILHELESINIITKDKWLDAPDNIINLAKNIKEYDSLDEIIKDSKQFKLDNDWAKYYNIYTDID